jgi:hypothetical protein
MSRRLTGGVLAALALSACVAAPAGAATINVTGTADVVADDEACSLREALVAAAQNAPDAGGDCAGGEAAPAPDVILLAAGEYSLAGPAGDDANAGGDLDIDLSGGPVVLRGAGAAATSVAASGSDRVLDAAGPGSLRIESVTIEGGAVAAPGGGIDATGADLELVDAAVSDNSSAGSTGTESGGGVHVDGGSLAVTRSTISSNEVVFEAAAGTVDGAALSGGGIDVDAAAVTISESEIRDNRVSSQNNTHQLSGGGIAVEQAAAQATITDSLIASNRVEAVDSETSDPVTKSGGGISFSDGDDPSPLRITNVTITDNDTSGDGGVNRGGGLFVKGGDVSVAHMTSTDNTGGSSQAIGYLAGAGGSFTIRASLLANGSGNECHRPLENGPPGGTFDDQITSLGYNRVQNGSFGEDGDPDTECYFQQPTDAGFRAVLSAGPVQDLADNGGPTETQAFTTDSVAIDVVPAAECIDASGEPLTRDQRHAPRPSGEGCDAGAYEEAYCEGEIVDLLGTPGPDTVVVDEFGAAVLAMGGDDVITDGPGDERICAGEGDDTIITTADARADTVDAGAGNDTFSAAELAGPLNVTVGSGDGAASGGGIGVDLLRSVEHAVGTAAGDLMVGDAGSNTLSGLGGPDEINPGPGTDSVLAGAGQDELSLRDEVADIADCGTELDRADADVSGVDSLVGCELVTFPAPPDTGTPPTPAQPDKPAKKKKCKKKGKGKRGKGCKRKKR